MRPRTLVALQVAVAAACVLAVGAVWLIGALGAGVYGAAWR